VVLGARGDKLLLPQERAFSGEVFTGREAGAYTRPLFCSARAIFVSKTPRNTQRIPQKALMMSRKGDECKSLARGGGAR